MTKRANKMRLKKAGVRRIHEYGKENIMFVCMCICMLKEREKNKLDYTVWYNAATR